MSSQTEKGTVKWERSSRFYSKATQNKLKHKRQMEKKAIGQMQRKKHCKRKGKG